MKRLAFWISIEALYQLTIRRLPNVLDCRATREFFSQANFLEDFS